MKQLCDLMLLLLQPAPVAAPAVSWTSWTSGFCAKLVL